MTAGHQSARAKDNVQLPEGSPAARELRELVLGALGQSPLFISAALPLQVFPPLFNRYSGGQSFGTHVDNAIRQVTGGGQRIRTDISATLFFTNPDEYEGGELVVEDTYGAQSIKLPAGHMILYPATSLHHVRPVTQGARVASFFWMQSMVRDDGRRTILFDLDVAIQRLNADHPDHPSADSTHRGLSQPAAAVGGGLMIRKNLLLASPGGRVAGRYRHLHHVPDRRLARVAATDHSLRRSRVSTTRGQFTACAGATGEPASRRCVEAAPCGPHHTDAALRSRRAGFRRVRPQHRRLPEPFDRRSSRRRLDGGSQLLPRDGELASMARRRTGIAGDGARRHGSLQSALSGSAAERPLSVAAEELEPSTTATRLVVPPRTAAEKRAIGTGTTRSASGAVAPLLVIVASAW